MNDISMPGNNRHPVDQLGQIRETIKILKERETELVAIVSNAMGDGDSLGGSEFIARQVMSNRKGSIDAKALEKAGIDVDAFRKPDSTVFQMRLERREMEGV